MEAPAKRITASYLSNCSPELAYQWLRDNSLPEGEANVWDLDYERKTIEYLLLRRNHSLIDLGLARYGDSSRALQKVFGRGDIGIRCAVLSNPVVYYRLFFWDEPALTAFLKEGSRAELQAIALNPYLPDYVFEQMIKRKGVFEGLSDNHYMYVLISLGKNKRFSTPYDRTILDCHTDYSYHSVFEAAWGLCKTLPAKEKWAYVLCSLLGNAQPPVKLEDLDEIISRWRIDRPKKADEKYYNPGYGFVLRSRVADLLDANENLLNSDDLALRKSFYRRFDPWKFKEWPGFLEKDGEGFLEEAISHNMELWKSKEERKRLDDVAWKCPDPSSDMMMPNDFRVMEKMLREKHPEWFYDEDDEPSGDTGAIIRRLEPALKTINDKIESLNEAVNSPRNVHALPPKNDGRWPWFVGGLTAGLLIAALFYYN